MGKIQENMLKLDISQIQNDGDTFFSPTDMAYLIFLIIGIAGYFTIPSVANYIVHAGGGHGLLHRVTSGFNTATRATSERVASTASGVTGTVREVFGAASQPSGNEYMKKRVTGQ